MNTNNLVSCPSLRPELESGEFGDVALVAAEGGERFVAHRLVLAYSSAHFARLLLPQPPSPSASAPHSSCPSSPSVSSPSSSRAPSSSRCGSPLASPTSPPARAANRSVSSDGALLGGSSAALVDGDDINWPKATKKKKKKKKDKDKEKEKRKEQRRAKKGKERALSSGNDSTEGSTRDSGSSLTVAVAAPTVPVATTSGGHKVVGEGAADKGSGTASGETAAEGGAAQPQIPAPPPPPVRLARRATGGSTSSGSVVLQRPSAQTLKRSNDTHHHHHHSHHANGIAISRSLSGSSNFFGSVRRGGGGGGGMKTASGSVMTLSSFGTPRSYSSSLSGEGAALAGSDLTTHTMDEVIYPSSSSTPPGTAGHERQAAVADELPVIQLDFPDPNRIFPAVLRFIYEGVIEILPENAIPLLAMADHYCIEILKKLCSDYVVANIDRENALWMLERAMLYNAEEIITTCVNVIARNFSYIYNANYNILPYRLLVSILEHPCLAVKALGEWPLFQIVWDYIKEHKDLTSQEQYRLFGTVRYRWMTTDELAQTQAANIVPSDFIIEALMARLKEAERDKAEEVGMCAEQDPTSRRLLPRPSFGILFDYAYDYDQKGIIFWIATNRGREPWTNPHSAGRLRVTASSIEKGDPVKLVSKKPSELWSGDVPASWFAIDLGPSRTLVPNYYTLRHGGNYKADSLRTWDLQGSSDGKTWIVLKRHTNDTSLSGPFATHSWPIPSVTEAYRHFRILQTGHNSSNHNFLVLSGVEFYGELYES